MHAQNNGSEPPPKKKFDLWTSLTIKGFERRVHQTKTDKKKTSNEMKCKRSSASVGCLGLGAETRWKRRSASPSGETRRRERGEVAHAQERGWLAGRRTRRCIGIILRGEEDPPARPPRSTRPGHHNPSQRVQAELSVCRHVRRRRSGEPPQEIQTRVFGRAER